MKVLECTVSKVNLIGGTENTDKEKDLHYFLITLCNYPGKMQTHCLTKGKNPTNFIMQTISHFLNR